jgi:hypothetical protein
MIRLNIKNKNPNKISEFAKHVTKFGKIFYDLKINNIKFEKKIL